MNSSGAHTISWFRMYQPAGRWPSGTIPSRHWVELHTPGQSIRSHQTLVWRRASHGVVSPPVYHMEVSWFFSELFSFYLSSLETGSTLTICRVNKLIFFNVIISPKKATVNNSLLETITSWLLFTRSSKELAVWKKFALVGNQTRDIATGTLG